MDNARYVEDDGKVKRKEGKKKDGKKDKKDRGYMMFEEDDSQEESLVSPEERETKSHIKLKKHSKPSFKFVKKEKSYKPKEKDKEEKKKDEKKKDEKLKMKKKRIPSDAALFAADEKPIFGVPLAVAVVRNKTSDGIQLPAMFRECIDYIEEFGLMCEGIYRISGVKSKVQALKDAYNKGLPVYLQEYEPNIVASLIKQFLRELPEPVLTTELTPKFEQASTIKSVKQRVCEFQHLIEQLPTPNRQLLSWVIIHMTHVIAKEKQNKMSVQNISIVLSPTMQISHRVLNILFTYSKILFRDTVIKKYVPPLKPVTSRWSLDLPESPSSLEEELRKQEVLLDELHREVMRVKDTEKEERLWEVQRVVTGLKRKLKLMNKAQNQSPSFARSMGVDRSKEIVTQTKPEPPKHLTLKLGDEELDLRLADIKTTKKQQSTKLAVKGEISPSKALAKKVGLKAVGTPTKDMSMDIGDIEMDSSAQSQKQRRDSREQLDVKESSNVLPEPRKHRESAAAKAEDVAIKTNEQKVVKPLVESTKKQESSPTQKFESSQVINADTKEKKVSPNKQEQVQIGDKIEGDKVKEKPLPPADKSKDIEKKVVSQEKERAVTVEESGDARKKSNTPSPDLTKQSATSVSAKIQAETIEKPQERKQAPLPPTIVSNETKTSIGEPKDSVTSKGKDNEKVDIVPAVAADGSPSGVAADELAAALHELENSETEEDLNQRVMLQFVADFGIERPAECDEEYEQLLDEYTALMLEEEELTIIGDELRAKIESEQYEIERLDEEITEVRAMREDLYSSDDKTDSSDSEDDDDDETLLAKLNQLIKDNADLQVQNKDLCNKIYQEVQDCLKTKVQIRMLQQKQLESSKSNELDLLL